MQSANFNGSCKNDNFQLKHFVLCFLFLLRTYCGNTLEQKKLKKCVPLLSLVVLYKYGVQGDRLNRCGIMLK